MSSRFYIIIIKIFKNNKRKKETKYKCFTKRKILCIIKLKEKDK